MTGDQSGKAPPRQGDDVRPAYEPPRLVPMGNVRDLVLGASVSGFDDTGDPEPFSGFKP